MMMNRDPLSVRHHLFLLLSCLALLLLFPEPSVAEECVYPADSGGGTPVWDNLVTCPESFTCTAAVNGKCEILCAAGYKPVTDELVCTDPFTNTWNAGELDTTDLCVRAERGPNTEFGIVMLVLTMPVGILCTYMFYRRRDVQPLKARQPILVVVASCMFLGWIFLLCVQRIVHDTYPCWLQLWTGYLGVLILANVYMIRCFILYANFVQTSKMVEIQKQIEEQQREKQLQREEELKRNEKLDVAVRIQQASRSHLLDPDGEDGGPGSHDAKLTLKRYRRFLRQSHLSYFTVIASVILLLPAIIVTAMFEDVRCWVGDGCLLHWHGAATALALYCAVYLLIFVFIAFKIRGKIDAFGIKTELKFVGAGGILALIPWFVFNNIESLQEINDEEFPFSTLFNILGVMNALLFGTAYPLWLSYHRPPVIEKPRNSKIDTLQELLEDPRGFESFKKFLTTEFSVENALFWKDVENYRQLVRQVQEMPEEDKMDEISRLAWASRRLYQDYVQTDGALEVNLPGNIVNDLDEAYNDIKHDMDELAQLASKPEKSRILANLILAKFAGPHPGQSMEELESACTEFGIGGPPPHHQPHLEIAPPDDNDPPPPLSDFDDSDLENGIPMDDLSAASQKQKSRKSRKSGKKRKKKRKKKQKDGKGMKSGDSSRSPGAGGGGRSPHIPRGARVPRKGIFDDAQENIFQLMQRDSEPRYRRSEIYDALVTTIRNEMQDHQNRTMLHMT